MQPIVSCIMPTRGRSDLAVMALRALSTQTYPNLEVIVMDDAAEPSFSKAPIMLCDVVYFRHGSRNIAEKRNICAQAAKGELICHWDSDDWSAPGRIADQVARIESVDKAVTGYHSMYFVHEEKSKAYWYQGDPSYAIGTSLLYRKEWWRDHPFEMPLEESKMEGVPGRPKAWGEDNLFVRDAVHASQLISVSADYHMVARIHSGNTSASYAGTEDPAGCSYRKVPFGNIPHEVLA